jgi:hypothetical protein
VPTQDEFDLDTLLEDLLSKSQRNDLFRAIELSGAPVTEFELTVRLLDGRYGPAQASLDHQASESYFAILPSGKTFSILGRLTDGGKAPGTQRYEADEEAYHNFNLALWGVRAHSLVIPGMNVGWPELLSLVETWARKSHEITEKYAATSDLWAQLRESKVLIAEQQQFANTPFTEPEQSEISSQIQRVKEYIRATCELTAEQLAVVQDRLDHAEEASHRIGRKDWLMLFNGALFSLFLSDLVPPQPVQHILWMTFQGLAHLFGIGGGPPSLSRGG